MSNAQNGVQASGLLQGACTNATTDGRWHDCARGEGRLFYVGANRSAFCRIDPKKNYIGLGFTNVIRDQVSRSLKLRTGRKDMAWVFVRRDDGLAAIAALIRQAAKATPDAARAHRARGSTTE